MLQENEIKRLIENDRSSKKKRYARIGMQYYDGDHDIKNYRVFYYNADGDLIEDKTRSNERISHPFFTELADQLAPYILSGKEKPIQATMPELQEKIDVYFDDDFYSELSETISGAYIKGFDFMYAYKNADDRIEFANADGTGVVEVRENESSDGNEYYIYWCVERIGKDNKQITRIQVHTENEVWYFVQEGDGAVKLDAEKLLNPQPNIIYTDEKGDKFGGNLGFMPFFCLSYNKKYISGLKPIKALIDDYDLMECGLSNNLQDFDMPVHVVKGFEGDDLDELIQNIRTKKTVGVGEGGGLDILTVDVPYQARKTKADEDEKNIYRFGMGLNTQSLKDSTATTNIAIKMAYTLLDLKAKKYEIRIKKFLKPIIKIVVDEINAVNGTDYQYSDVVIDFKHELIINDTETAQNSKTKADTEQVKLTNILNISSFIGDEETLRLICDTLDLDFEKISEQVKEKSDISTAKAILDDISVEGDEYEQPTA